jgi:hypothetical protein
MNRPGAIGSGRTAPCAYRFRLRLQLVTLRRQRWRLNPPALPGASTGWQRKLLDLLRNRTQFPDTKKTIPFVCRPGLSGRRAGGTAIRIIPSAQNPLESVTRRCIPRRQRNIQREFAVEP